MRKEVEFSLTAEELAKEFANLDNEQMAVFFDSILQHFPTKHHLELQVYDTLTCLKQDGLFYIKVINDFSEEKFKGWSVSKIQSIFRDMLSDCQVTAKDVFDELLKNVEYQGDFHDQFIIRVIRSLKPLPF